MCYYKKQDIFWYSALIRTIKTIIFIIILSIFLISSQKVFSDSNINYIVFRENIKIEPVITEQVLLADVYILNGKSLNAPEQSKKQDKKNRKQLNKETVPKNPWNPMKNFNYNSASGDYYKANILKLNQLKVSQNDHRYNHFPLKYYCKSIKPDQKKIIEAAIKEFSAYFPLEETGANSDAELIIEVNDKVDVAKITGVKESDKVLGYGGRQTRTLSSKGKINILPVNFNLPYAQAKATVIHEICHSFGIQEHSEDPNDLMYYANHGGNNNLTPRDLNTLWLIYNDQ